MRIRSLSTLRREAAHACANRGHRMRWTLYFGGVETVNRPFGHGSCRDCSLGVTLDTKPAANGIDIGGEAVALDCLRLGAAGAGIRVRRINA